jgi:hypothetical protein
MEALSKIVLVVCVAFLAFSCKKEYNNVSSKLEKPQNLIAVLDTIWDTEQLPIRRRDSLMRLYGAKSQEYKEQQAIYEKNHRINEQKITQLLDTYGWPTIAESGARVNWTICNVIQHADNEVRIKYLPMMRQAVKDKHLEPRFLARAEDRIATERGDLQIYGGQMKYYKETKSFNLWPVYDPVNIDKRRAEIGLEPISDFLKARFDFEWNLEEQITRTEAFLKTKNKRSKE